MLMTEVGKMNESQRATSYSNDSAMSLDKLCLTIHDHIHMKVIGTRYFVFFHSLSLSLSQTFHYFSTVLHSSLSLNEAHFLPSFAHFVHIPLIIQPLLRHTTYTTFKVNCGTCIILSERIKK